MRERGNTVAVVLGRLQQTPLSGNLQIANCSRGLSITPSAASPSGSKQPHPGGQRDIDREQKLMDHIAKHNEARVPFVWTKSVEAILEKVGRTKLASRLIFDSTGIFSLAISKVFDARRKFPVKTNLCAICSPVHE